MAMNTRRIGNMIFEKSADGYVFFFSKTHSIFIRKGAGRGWIAKEMIRAGKGRFANPSEYWETIRACTGENLEDALSGILESM